jgi:hypothetical protein
MLRLRKKPPEGLPTINAGTPWSDLDLEDLQIERERGTPVRQIADLLAREVLEVELKIVQLELGR